MAGCTLHHDAFNAVLTFGLCLGLIVSYLPQHLRIIQTRSSEGLSPVFLLLGTASAASALLNMITLQAPIIQCCTTFGLFGCLESTAGVIQLGIQWFCFSLIFVLYIVYYPSRLKHVETDLQTSLDTSLGVGDREALRTEEWQLSVVLAWLAGLHLAFVSVTTFYLLGTAITSPDGTPPEIASWATFLGVSAATLAAIQYAPQLAHTYKAKVVGALSIPMMCIQTPGGILMITSIVLRPGTNWTSWITFAVAAALQGCLLGMCIVWKYRQGRLGIDDFGNPLSLLSPSVDESLGHESGTDERTLLLSSREP